MLPPRGQPLVSEKDAVGGTGFQQRIPFVTQTQKLADCFDRLYFHVFDSSPAGVPFHDRHGAEFQVMQSAQTPTIPRNEQPAMLPSLAGPLKFPLVVTAKQ